ncbi:hypothetical protein TNCV_950151 [Trichonephila clavipes]|nr:hypothetical protein TNCV_950151 [Trichonephila clavipes]
MSGCPDQVVILKRDSERLDPQASLVLSYRSTAFSVTVKKRTEVVSPPPPIPLNRHHEDRIASWKKKGERGPNVTCVISV